MKDRRQVHNHPEMTPQELARCKPAVTVDQLGLPIPTHLVSNEEYFPPFLQTSHQKRVEAQVMAAVDQVPKRLNISRRRFLATSAGLAASFVALNEVFRDYAFGEALFRVAGDAGVDHDAFQADGPPADLFVFDDQCHLVRGSHGGGGYAGGSTLLALAQGESARFPNSPFVSNPWNAGNEPDEHGASWANMNPALIGRTHWDDREFWLPNFIRSYFFESQTTVALISNLNSSLPSYGAYASGTKTPGTARNVYEARPQEAFLTAEQSFACRQFINGLAGSTRALTHGLMYMGPGNLWYLQEQMDRFTPDSWKGYQLPNAKRDNDPDTVFEHWRFDDEELAFPTFEFIRDAHRKHRRTKPGLNCINVHKGLGPSADPTDIPAAAAAFPELNFVIYHSCIRPAFFFHDAWKDIQSGRLRDGVPDIKDTTEFVQLVAPYPNVYAELGTIFACSVVTFPTVCAHVLGVMFKYLGADRIVWGTDSTFYGSPQWQIEAFWRLQIPEEMRRRYGYPEITEAMKRKVLGLTSGRLYGMIPDLTRYPEVSDDYQRRLLADAQLVRTMEYDDRLPHELPVQGSPRIASPLGAPPYGVAAANRPDRLESLRADYREAAGTRFGVPRSNRRDGWIRVR